MISPTRSSWLSFSLGSAEEDELLSSIRPSYNQPTNRPTQHPSIHPPTNLQNMFSPHLTHLSISALIPSTGCFGEYAICPVKIGGQLFIPPGASLIFWIFWNMPLMCLFFFANERLLKSMLYLLWRIQCTSLTMDSGKHACIRFMWPLLHGPEIYKQQMPLNMGKKQVRGTTFGQDY